MSEQTDPPFDYCILGAGLAGLSLADALVEQDLRVCVLDRGTIASGASGTPLGMVNPATGRRATKTWRAEQCYRAILENLKKTAPFSERTFYRVNGVLRPALTAKIAREMSTQLEETRWPEGWIEWLDEDRIKEKHPGITCVDGGLWLPIGITVDVAEYLRALSAYLQSRGSEVIEQAEYQYRQVPGGWQISLEDTQLACRRLVYATGRAMVGHPSWDFLDLHPIKGQMALFATDRPLTFDYSISSLGYIARLNGNWFAQGSTYEHDYESLETDEFGEEYLRNRLKRTLPELEAEAKLQGQWAGVRISTPNRKPVMGPHPTIPNLYAYTGLGSKGLMYGKHLARHFAEHLTGEVPLMKSLDIARFSAASES